MRGKSCEIEIEIESTKTHLDQIQRPVSVSRWRRETESRVAVSPWQRETESETRVRECETQLQARPTPARARPTPPCEARSTCHCRCRLPLLDLPSQPSFEPSQFTGIYSYLFLQNLVIWESKKLCLCLVDLWCFIFVFLLMSDELNWFGYCELYLCCDYCLWCFFFFFFGLFGFVTLCLWLLHYIDKRDR